MPEEVKKKEKEIEHLDSEKTATSAPDVCKTPESGGPVPVPYPNTAESSEISSGTKRVKIEGKEVFNKEKSSFKSSTGDEAPTRSPLEPVEGYLPKMTRLFRERPILIIVSLAVLCFVVWFPLSDILYNPPMVEEPFDEPLGNHLVSMIAEIACAP